MLHVYFSLLSCMNTLGALQIDAETDIGSPLSRDNAATRQYSTQFQCRVVWNIKQRIETNTWLQRKFSRAVITQRATGTLALDVRRSKQLSQHVPRNPDDLLGLDSSESPQAER